MIDRIVFLLLLPLVVSLCYEFFFTSAHKGPLSSLKLLVVVTVSFWLLKVWREGSFRWNRASRSTFQPPWHGLQPLVILAAAFWLGLFGLALLHSADLANSLKFAGKMAVEWLVFLVVLATLRNRMDRIRLLLRVFCLNSVVVTLVGMGEIVNWGWAEKFISVFRTGRFFLGDAVRLSGTLEYPNTTAVFLAQAVLLAVFLSLADEKDQWPSLRRFGILLWVAVFLIAAVGLILTYSRGGWLEVVAGLAGGILLCCWSKEKQWAVRLTIVFAALMLLYLSMAYYSPYLRLRALSFEPLPFFRVEYELDEESLILKPGQEYSLQMVLHNHGLMTLEASGEDPYLFTYLWFDASGNRIVAEREILTPLPRDLLPGSALKVEARFRAPDAEGEYVTR